MSSAFGEARIAVVGATGAVGTEALAILNEWGHPAELVRAFAKESARTGAVTYGDARLPTLAVTPDAVADADLVLLAAGAEAACELAPELVERGVRVVDCSSAFRTDPRVPLVVPEVNGRELRPETRLVANPNCSATLLLVALDPLRQAFGIERIVVSTYQAVSGAGREGMQELLEQTRAVLDGGAARPSVFPEPCAFNVFPHESPLEGETGFNGEETKLARETQRVWGDPELEVVATCARVPVVRSHCQSILVSLAQPASAREVGAALASGAGVAWHDDPRGSGATALDATGTDAVHVGRLRLASGASPGREWCLWLAGDQLRKGAALNALQIGQRLLALP